MFFPTETLIAQNYCNLMKFAFHRSFLNKKGYILTIARRLSSILYLVSRILCLISNILIYVFAKNTHGTLAQKGMIKNDNNNNNNKYQL